MKKVDSILATQVQTAPFPRSISASKVGLLESEIEKFFADHPSSLCLGPIEILRSQVMQEFGILDILAFQKEMNTYYEIEVMRGEVDIRHITHSLDNWAKELDKRIFSNHVAVIVSESCRGRYHTLLRTLPRFLPIIIMEFGVFEIEGSDTKFLKCEPIYYPELFAFKSELRPSCHRTRNPLLSKTALQFISHLLRNDKLITKPFRDIADHTGISLGQTSNLIRALQERGWVREDKGIRMIMDKQRLQDHLDDILRALPDRAKYIEQRASSSSKP